MPGTGSRLLLVLSSFAFALAGLEAQGWAERGSRPRFYATVDPDAGPGGGALLFKNGRIRSWDGTGWRAVAELSGSGVNVISHMAWDHARARTVGLGLDLTPFPYQPRTFEIVDGVFQLATAIPPAATTEVHYDPALGGVVAFTESTSATQDYLWDGTAWNPLPADVRPRNVRGMVVADLQRSRLVAFTPGSPGPGGETYEWDGIAWTLMQPAAAPPVRETGAMQYDPASGLTTLYGGKVGTTTLRDTWHWNGTTWFQVGGTNTPPTSFAVELILDRVGGGLRLLDLAASSTFDHRWSGSTWLPQDKTPPAFADLLLGNDLARGTVTMLMGDLTYEWDGAVWILAARVGTGLRSLTQLAFDPSRSEMVVFGGIRSSGQLGDTWTWNGAQWAQAAPPVSPPARGQHALFTSTAANGVVLFGGMSNSVVPLDDTWLWSGGSWTQLSYAVHPVGGRSVGASGRSGQTPMVASQNELWSFNGNWTFLDNHVPITGFQTMELTAAGNPVVLSSASIDRSYEFRNGAWIQDTGPGTEVAGLAFDPLRGSLFGVGYGHEVVYSDALATAEVVGLPCTNGRFAITATGDPFLGNAAFRVNADGAQGFALFGFSVLPAQIPLGGGCYSYLGNPIPAGFVANNAYGIASLGMSVPLVPALRGARLRLQAAGPQAGGPYAGLAISAGLDVTIGN